MWTIISKISELESKTLRMVAAGILLVILAITMTLLSATTVPAYIVTPIGMGCMIGAGIVYGMILDAKFAKNLMSTHDCPIKGKNFMEIVGTKENHWQFCPWCGVKLTNIQEVK
jgi:hypothetical protein